MKSELSKRIVTGIIAALVGGLAIFAGGFTFYIFVLALSFMMSMEFDKMRADGKISFLYCALPVLLSFHALTAFGLILVAIGMVMLGEKASKTHYPWLLITILYVTIPSICLIWLRNLPNGLELVAWLVLCVIATDTFAYFTGRKFGKKLLAPKISPKKTREGLAGGVIAASVISYIYTGSFAFAAVAVFIAIAAQAGDLTESAIKRNFGVKDSGNILPGHGGIMDRLDGLLFTAPIAAAAAHLGLLVW